MNYVYSFLKTKNEFNHLYGEKSKRLSLLAQKGFPTPKGFIITTEACKSYYDNQGKIKSNVVGEIFDHIIKLEQETDKNYGKGKNPLFLHIETDSENRKEEFMGGISNVGLNDEIVDTLIKEHNDPKFVYSMYCDFIKTYACTIKRHPKEIYENYLETKKKDIDFDIEELKELAQEYKSIYETYQKKSFPTDPKQQLLEVIASFFRNWNNKNLVNDRNNNSILSNLGISIIVREMRYSNNGWSSGYGSVYSRNPLTGENEIYGSYAMNSKKEIANDKTSSLSTIKELKETMPHLYDKLNHFSKLLERQFRDMQEISFIIEDGNLYLTNVKDGRRNEIASLKIAIDFVSEKILTKEQAILKIDGNILEQLLEPKFDENIIKRITPIAKGKESSSFIQTGNIYFDIKSAKHKKEMKEQVILFTDEPLKCENIDFLNGIITSSKKEPKIASIAEDSQICYISECEDYTIENQKIYFKNGIVLEEGNTVSIDGKTGLIYQGLIPKKEIDQDPYLNELLNWLKLIDTIDIKANVENERDTTLALNLKGNGIGLYKTENLFSKKDRLFSFQKMIFASNQKERIQALNELLPYQRNDFFSFFQKNSSKSVKIRLFHGSFQEYYPTNERAIKNIATALHQDPKCISRKMNELMEINPTLGVHGSRLLMKFPEIIIMQVKAMIEAVILLMQEKKTVSLEILLSSTTDSNEFEFIKKIIDNTANKIMNDHHITISYKVGMIIDTPWNSIMVEDYIDKTEGFLFDIDSIMELTSGMNKKAQKEVFKIHKNSNILNVKSFYETSEKGIEFLLKNAIKMIKMQNQRAKIGFCKNDFLTKNMVCFCYKSGMDYISCAPEWIPIVKLMAAQIKLQNENIMR